MPTESKVLTRSRSILDPGWTLISGGSVCKSLKNLVGASGFEPPTSWSRTINPRTIKDLEEAQRFAQGCDMSRVFKGLRAFRALGLAIAGTASMRGVGTKMGTVFGRA